MKSKVLYIYIVKHSWFWRKE